MSDCIFCKIIKGEVPAEIIKKTDNLVVFLDNNPSAETHILIVPKEHLSTFMNVEMSKHKDLLTEMYQVAQELIKEKGIQNKYKLIINGGEYPHVLHLHLHVLGGDIIKHV